MVRPPGTRSRYFLCPTTGVEGASRFTLVRPSVRPELRQSFRGAQMSPKGAIIGPNIEPRRDSAGLDAQRGPRDRL